MIRPFLKWAGGKSWLVPTLHRYGFLNSGRRLVEPFLGGGAVLLNHSGPKLGSDTNAALVSTWEQVAAEGDSLAPVIWSYGRSRESFSAARAGQSRLDRNKAARFIYLNRCSWGGLHRVNGAGQLNTPYGLSSDRVIIRRRTLREAQDALRQAELICADFRSVLAHARSTDLCFVDPPYLRAGSTENGFRRYTEQVFDSRDFLDLVELCAGLQSRGALVVLESRVTCPQSV